MIFYFISVFTYPNILEFLNEALDNLTVVQVFLEVSDDDTLFGELFIEPIDQKALQILITGIVVRFPSQKTTNFP